MFLRFFSHEIRTPLNSVYVGVTIILNELRQQERQQEIRKAGSLLETAADSQRSCQAAIEVLNGMILYDRIISGYMSLEKEIFDPWPLICDAVFPFKALVSVSLPLIALHCVLKGPVRSRPKRRTSTCKW